MGVITDVELKNLLHYKYKGGDTSYIYSYLLSPFAQYLVDTTIPHWIAPNLITLIGLMFSIVSFLCTVIYNPSLESNAPRWLHLLIGVNLFIYQTLDNMDGKQVNMIVGEVANYSL
jgi:uncharacterized membrane protein